LKATGIVDHALMAFAQQRNRVTWFARCYGPADGGPPVSYLNHLSRALAGPGQDGLANDARIFDPRIVIGHHH
jgi:hypothetical protein